MSMYACMLACTHSLCTFLRLKNTCACSAAIYTYILVSCKNALQPHTYKHLNLSVFSKVVPACATLHVRNPHSFSSPVAISVFLLLNIFACR